MIAGLVIFFIMRALGEMAIEQPVAGSFSKYAYDYIGPLAGYITGWNTGSYGLLLVWLKLQQLVFTCSTGSQISRAGLGHYLLYY